MKRTLIPVLSFVAGSALMAAIYIGVLAWLQDWEYALFQFSRDRSYVVPIIVAFGVQAALYSVIRFRLYAPVRSTRASGAMMGASGGTSATSMVACCLHHVTNVLPVLGISAATGFLARYQRPFMQLGLSMNLIGIMIMLVTLYRARQSPGPLLELT